MDFTARYTMIGEDGGFRFRFYCQLCEEGHLTGLISAGSFDEAFQIACSQAKRHFNGCHRCGKWVCDAHYNEDEMMCSNCAPQMGRK
jgi:hypothetical protein